MNSINEQKPATKNQITNTKPNVPKTTNVLQGWIGNSINGGFIKPIHYKQVMAGEKIIDYHINANIKMLTPLTPAYQKLKATFKAYFVPNSRVWTNAEKFTAQKGGATVTKIKEIPNIGGLKISKIQSRYPQGTEPEITSVLYTDTDMFRDSWASAYIPKWMTGKVNITNSTNLALPKYSILPFRGFKAIYNDFERNKEYDEELTEYKGDTVTNNEWRTIIPDSELDAINKYTEYVIRGKRQNSYYTDYRTEMLGENITEPTTGNNDDLIQITEWEKKVAEMRSEAENAQLNDWDIIAKIRGSKRIKTGKVQLLGIKTIGLNFQAITQSTYNVNPEINEEFQVMGTQGAYSYTEVDLSMFQMTEFEEEGYIHITMQVTADNVYETGFERTGLNVNIMDLYRPDLKDLKHDVLYRIEKDGSRGLTTDNINAVDGFKRKYSELFKLPNVVAGDITTMGAYETEALENSQGTIGGMVLKINDQNEPIRLQSKRTFQFFEIDDRYTGRYKPKKIWKDYTDFSINKNMAVMQEEEEIKNTNSNTVELRIKGDNQIFFIGIATCIADLPVDGAIKDNFTTWGEK